MRSQPNSTLLKAGFPKRNSPLIPRRTRYYSAMKKWIDPVKNQPAKDETLNTPGDFGEFTALMRKIVNKREEEPKTPSVSPVPDAS